MLRLASTRRIGPVGEAIFAACAYFLCAGLTLQLTRFDGGVAVVWLAGPLLFAWLSAVPRRHWRRLTLACTPAGILASLVFGVGGYAAVGVGCICVGEAFAAAWLLKRFCPRYGHFASVVEVARFLAVAGVLVPAASSTLAAACVHWRVGVPYAAAWRDWYAGHALGLIAFAPPLLLTLRGEMGRWVRAREHRRSGEAAWLLAAVFAATMLTFAQSAVPLVVVPIVPMMACTFRLGRFGAVASIVILIGIGMSCSLAGLGPTAFLHGGMSLKFQVLQIYFATIVVILLPVAAELKTRRRLTERLRTAEELHRLILDRTGDVVLRCDIEGHIRYVSPLVEQEWGLTPEEMAGRSILDFIWAEDVAAVRAARSDALARPDATATVEYRIKRKDRRTTWVESHVRANLDAGGHVVGTISIVREITERRRLVEDLAHKATVDPLTGLLNRRAFDEALARCAADTDTAAPGVLALFDLDHFKRINDGFGHAAGDLVLKHFAELLRSSVRDGDIAARLGGEEFAVLLRGATVDQAFAVCERVRVRLASSVQRPSTGVTIRATVSAGIALVATSVDPAVILAAADAALYQAKNAGRNRLALAA